MDPTATNAVNNDFKTSSTGNSHVSLDLPCVSKKPLMLTLSHFFSNKLNFSRKLSLAASPNFKTSSQRNQEI